MSISFSEYIIGVFLITFLYLVIKRIPRFNSRMTARDEYNRGHSFKARLSDEVKKSIGTVNSEIERLENSVSESQLTIEVLTNDLKAAQDQIVFLEEELTEAREKLRKQAYRDRVWRPS